MCIKTRMIFLLFTIIMMACEISFSQQVSSSPKLPYLIQEREKNRRVFIKSGYLYVYNRHLSPKGCFFRLNMNNLNSVDRIFLSVAWPSLVRPLFKITDHSIYTTGYLNTYPEVGAGIHEFELDTYAPVTYDLLTITNSKKREPDNSDLIEGEINIIPINPMYSVVLRQTPRTGNYEYKRRSGRLYDIWHDFVMSDDGSYYLYILDDKELVIWKKPITTGRQNDWVKVQSYKKFPPEEFWVSKAGNASFITTASGNVFSLADNKLTKITDSFEFLSTTSVDQNNIIAADNGRTYQVDNLDSGEQWAVKVDANGKVITRAHHLIEGAFSTTDLPLQFSEALLKVTTLLEQKPIRRE